MSHTGHGIVSKALYHGVPMVLLLWDRDQPGVAARVERLGVARVVPRAEIVAGKVLVRDGEVLVADETTVRAEAQAQAEKVAQRVAADPVHKEMVLLEAICRVRRRQL